MHNLTWGAQVLRPVAFSGCVVWLYLVLTVSVDAQPAIKPTLKDVSYGPHERNTLDLWQAKSDQPTPLLISIHGGGFILGNKTVPKELLKSCLDAGISVAAINYRYSTQAIAPAAFHDGGRAVQFLRFMSKDWNLDPQRIASSGESAGAGISLWLGCHPDLIEPDSNDPVSRQSTRLTCVFVFEGQSSYDPRFIRNMFPDKDVYKSMPLQKLFDINIEQLDDLPVEKYRLFEEVSAINLVTKESPPVLLSYSDPMDVVVSTQRIGMHHPLFGKLLKEKLDPVGVPCEVIAAGKQLDGGPPTKSIDFLKRHFQIK